MRDLLLQYRDRFEPTIANVMATVISPSYRALDRVMTASIDPIKLSGRVSMCLKCGGYIVRKVGPTGKSVHKDFPSGAEGMHIDQDLTGEFCLLWD
jgi:hypothetical protein